MKKLLVALVISLCSISMMAVPVKPGMWLTIMLADGTQVSVERVGDENGHWLRAADGSCYVERNGAFEKADRTVLEEHREQRIVARRASRRAIFASTSDGLGSFGTMSRGAVPSIGEYTIPVVMVQFSNLSFRTTTTVEKMQRYYNEEGYSDNGSAGSVRDYFVAQSGGQFIPNFDIVGMVTLDKTYQYYGKNDSQGNDQHLDELPGDVIAAAIEQLGTDFSSYVVPAGDGNHSEGVPLLVMFYAGKGEATEYYGGDNYLWPCEWDDVEDAQGGNYADVHFNSFFIGNELYSGGLHIMGQGVFCHEFGHALGLPDFYCTNDSYLGDDAFGNWSIMDTGAYVGDSFKPIGYNAYEKSYMGWLDLKEIEEGTEEVVLNSPDGLAEGSAIIVRNPNNQTSVETFIFENRQPGTWYPSQYGSGVLATRIAYQPERWSYNVVNNIKSKKRACVMKAGGDNLYYTADKANLYGYSVTSIETLKNFSGSDFEIGFTNITKNDDGTISIALKQQETHDPDNPDNPDPGVNPGGDTSGILFSETFDGCNGKGGNDDLWSGNIALGAFNTDNEGWLTEKAFGANQCAKFGTGNDSGMVTTPGIVIDGSATLTFRAGAWNSSKDSETLYLMAEGGTIVPEEVTMTKGAFTEFETTLTPDGESMTVTFAAAGGRFFLDDVLVRQDGAETAIRSITTSADSCIYTLDGRYAGTDLHQLSRGVYVRSGRKVLVK